MNIAVVLKMVPDVVEELEVAPDGTGLDPDALRMILSESDEHALEQALLIKEREGGQVTVVALDAPDVDDTLFTAIAKGADRAVKVEAGAAALDVGAAATALCEALAGLAPAPDLVLTGTQAIDDLQGLAAPWLAHLLKRPYVGIVTSLQHEAGSARVTVLKEFPNSVRGEIELPLPAVIGIQAAEKPPRYVPVAKVRAVTKTQRIDEAAATQEPPASFVEVREMAKPEAAGHAEMLEGEPEETAARLVKILETKGLA